MGREGVHFLSVNGDNILDKIEQVERNTTLRNTLLKGALDFQRAYLSRDALIDRWWSILKLLVERQVPTEPKFNPKFACTCDDALLAQKKVPECLKCEIMRMKDSRLAKFVGVVPKTLP